MLLIDSKTVLESPAADLSHAAKVVEKLFEARREGSAASAQEVPMRPRAIESAFYSLPALIESEGIAGIKWTTHARAGNPYTKPLVILNDLRDGTPLALIDGWVISAVRTAAVSLAFYRHLEGLEKNAVLLCGAGHQAEWQGLALFERFADLGRLYIWSRKPEHAEDCRRRILVRLEASGRTADIRIVNNFRDALEDVDFVVGATSADEPYLQKKDLAGCGYVHIGMNDASREALLSYPSIICDEFESAKLKSAQSLFRLWRRDNSVEERIVLLEEYEGVIPIGERFCFDAFGLSIFDLGLAAEAYRYALACGKGVNWPVFGR